MSPCPLHRPCRGLSGPRLRRTSRLTIVLFGRHRPAGLTFTNDDELHKLLSDLEAWKSNLPEDLQFRGPETPMNAGELPSTCTFRGFRRGATTWCGPVPSALRLAVCERSRTAGRVSLYGANGCWALQRWASGVVC